MTEKRKPGWAFWTTVAMLVVYIGAYFGTMKVNLGMSRGGAQGRETYWRIRFAESEWRIPDEVFWPIFQIDMMVRHRSWE